jgi:hypothetical protein
MPDPLLTTTFTLTRADALAWERHARRPTLPGTILFLLWLALGPAIAWLLPDSWAGTPATPAFWALAGVLVAILYVLAMIAFTVGDMRRASRRIRRAHDLTIEEYPDHLAVTGTGIPRTLSFAEAGRPIVTRTHLFIGQGDDLIILPRRAFPEEESFDALAGRLTAAALAAAAVPVDPAPSEGISPAP